MANTFAAAALGSLLLAASPLLSTAVLSPHLMKMRSRHMKAMRGDATDLSGLPADQYYNQTLDHFNALNGGWWNQRFWVNSSLFTPGSAAPVFFYVEGEGSGSPLDVVQGQHVELAANYGGLIVALEHRFYGNSSPTADWTDESMALLSSHQAIADTARFIREYLMPTFNLTSENRIITFGGSYSGALSAWIRLRIPHLVFAAFSTSSPVTARLDFTGYNTVVAQSMNNTAIGGSYQCLSALTAAFQVIDTALRGSPAQQAKIASQLYSCAPPQNINDVKLLASNLAGVVMGVVQYNDEGFGGMDVASMCQTLTANGVQPIDAFASIVQASLGGASCMDNSYTDFIAQVGNTTVTPNQQGVGMRQWTFQTCTQLGYYQTCPSLPCPFSSLLDLASQIQICNDAFDPRLTGALNADRINFTNDYYGATDLGIDRILFTNGLVDPWHMLSVLPANNTNAGNDAIVIPTGAHCRNMFPSKPSDPADVKAARAEAATILQGWLAA